MIRAVWCFLLGVAGLVAVYCSAALIGAAVPGGQQDLAGQERPHTVLMAAGPIHYDFLIPLDKQARAQFAFLESAGLPVGHPEAEWLLLGWGAREFYTSAGSYRDVPVRAVIKGILGDTAVLRADVLGAIRSRQELPAVRFSGQEYAAFLTAAAGSFSRSAAGAVLPLEHPGFTATDRFFEANGRFHILRTCNTWISRMIRASGRRFGLWTPVPFSVTLSHRLHLDG